MDPGFRIQTIKLSLKALAEFQKTNFICLKPIQYIIAFLDSTFKGLYCFFVNHFIGFLLLFLVNPYPTSILPATCSYLSGQEGKMIWIIFLGHGLVGFPIPIPLLQIGRASCRERV